MRITWAFILLLLFSVTAHAQNDCPDAIIVCGDANYYDLEAEGPGQNNLEINPDNACASGENNTIWLKIQINQGGTLGFILTPEEDDMVIDFDFWLFGPIETCDVIGTAIRCSTTNPLQAGLDYITTGMNEESTDVSEGPGPDGDAFIHWIDVEDNEFYYLAIDRPHGFGNFSMEWTGTATFHKVPEFLNPNNIPLDIQQCDKDGVNDESTAFDLTVYNDMFIGVQNPMAITYHDDLNGAITGQDPILDPTVYENVTNPQTIYLRMINTVTNCYSTQTFTIEVTPSMEAGLPDDLFLCDTNKDGFQEFDLSVNDDNVRDINPATTQVTYYTSLNNARNGTNPVGPVFTNTIPYIQTIWTRLEDINDCFSYDFHSFTLNVIPLPSFENPENISIDIIQCDSDGVNDGKSIFNLATHAAMLIGSQQNVAITYYLTQEDADAGTNEITDYAAYTNLSDPQTIYMRIYNSDTTCYDTLPFEISIERVAVGVPDNYAICDTNENGFQEFELFQNDDVVKNGDAGTVTYHLTETDAKTGSNPLPPVYQNAVAYETQTIWARFQNDFGPCVGYGVASFTLTILPLPEIRNPQNISFDQVKCDLDGIEDTSTPFDLTLHSPVMTGNQDMTAITYHTSQQDADDSTNSITIPEAYSNIANPQTIFVRLTNEITGCYKTGAFTITILPIPDIPALPALNICDFNNDGFALFDLTTVLQQIVSDLGNVTVTAFETPDDAIHNVNKIPNPEDYTNIDQDTQTLYIRAESALGCFDVAELQLIVNPVPEAVAPEPYLMCDNGDSDNDGTAIFDLTSKTGEILGILSPAQYTVSFYINQAAAIAGTPAIIDVISYASENNTIYVRVTNNATGCYDIVELKLIVNPLPELITNQSTYTLCDITAPANDEREVFDLTSKIPDFIADIGNVAISFHHTFADAQNNTAAIQDPTAYTNQSNGVETIFVRFTFENTQCFRIGFLDVRVVPLPIILPPVQDELTVCDTNGQGIGEFNLTALVDDMKNNETSLVITFHETIENAQNGIFPIPNPEAYINAIPYIQFIYVRVVEPQYGCYNTYQLKLIVEPAPQSPFLDDLTFCDDADNNNTNKTRTVDLTVQSVVIADALGIAPEDIPALLKVEYYTTETGANSTLEGLIVNPTTYMGTDGQTIWVRVENPDTECYSVESFQLKINAPLALTTPTPFVKCNEALPNDGQTEFDLTDKNDEILGAAGQGQGYIVEYFESDPKAGATPIADPANYTNPLVPNPKTLYVRVTNDLGCVSYTTLTIKVLALPVPDTTPDALVKCDDTAPDGTEVFDLTQAAADIKDNGSNYELTYYPTENDAREDLNAIADPTAYTSGSGSVWVRVALNNGNPAEPKCAQFVELQLIVNPLPPIADLGPYAICEQNTDGEAEFDIQGYVNEALGGNTGGEYDVDFFTDSTLATPAVPVNAYQVTGGSATVYVRVINLTTGCQVVKELQLLVEEGAIANDVVTVFDECDYDAPNDGIRTWDLTPAGADALGSQPQPQYAVSYYENEADAKADINPIADPTAYINSTPDQQEIWIRVVNTATVTGCPAYTSFTLITERLAAPQITGGTICVDYITQEVLRPLTIDSGVDLAYTFKWYHNGTEMPDETEPSIIAIEEGTYTVIAISAEGCESAPIEPITVVKSGPASPVDEGYYVTNAFTDNQTITIRAEGYGVYEYKLDISGQWQNSNIFTNVTPGTHIVYIRDANTDGCGEISLTGVNVIDYPNFFTPNGDTFRDTWNIIGLNQKDAKIYIFDRYGKLLKQISAVGEGWDGTFNGHALPASDYWFTVTYKEFDGVTTVTKVFKAHFSLLR